MKKPATVYNVIAVLEATFKVIDQRGGYVSQKSVEGTGNLPTSHWVLQQLKMASEKPGGSIHQSKIEEILHHFRNIDATGDQFLQKVQEILRIGQVSDRMIGFVVALPSLFEKKYNRAEKLTKFADKYASSKHIGKVGTRDEFAVKLLDIGEFMKPDEQTGQQVKIYIYRCADQLGNFCFFFSREKLPMEQWDCFSLRATPKKHDVNKETGIRETQFSRVRVTEMIGKGTAE